MAVRLLVRILVVASCAAVAVVSLIARDSRIAKERATAAYYANDRDEALRAADQAKRLNPDYMLDLIRARLQPERGASILAPALRREPDNAELWLGLAAAERYRGDERAARAAYARARELIPSLPATPP